MLRFNVIEGKSSITRVQSLRLLRTKFLFPLAKPTTIAPAMFLLCSWRATPLIFWFVSTIYS
jgi:hypothetical protein